MPSCSGNHKQAPMTGGGVGSMLRRAKSKLRKLTKRNKPTKPANASYEMVDLTPPTIASTRFGPKSMYNNREVHRQAVDDLEQHGLKLKNNLSRTRINLKFWVDTSYKLGKQNQKLTEEKEKLGKELKAAVDKLAECETGKASLGRRHAAAAKMYRAAHVDRTLGALKGEELLAEAMKQVKELQGQYDSATKHAGTKSEKVTELGMKLTAANAKVAELESNLESAKRRTQLANSRAASLELESDVLKAQYAAAAEKLENDKQKHSKELTQRNNLLAAARNQFAEVEANRKLKSKASKLAENNTFTRRLKAGVQLPKSSKKSKYTPLHPFGSFGG